MELAGSPFYTSGTFWAGAGTVVGVISIVAIVWVTIRVANPKRRLWCSMSAVTPLVAREKVLTRELKIIYGDDRLESPHTANIQLVSKGRLDIPRSAFDGDEPLQLDVGVPIVEILNVATSPDRPIPPVKNVASKLFIGPSLIGRREKIVISLLVEGDPDLQRPPQSLENVDIRPGDPDVERARRLRNLNVVVTAAASLLAAVLGLIVSAALH